MRKLKNKVIEFCAETYSAESLLRSSYELIGRGGVRLLPQENPAVRAVELSSTSDDYCLDELEVEFLQHVADFSLRERLESKFGQLRMLLYAQAFSSADLVLPEVSLMDGWEDPLSISPREGNSSGRSFGV